MNGLRTYFFLFCVTCILPLHAQYTTRSFASNIKSVQIANYDRNPLYPVVDLNSDEHVVLSFDDLNADAASYSYRITHCTALWQKSNLQESEYMNGFTINYIDQNETSFNTYFNYDHYALTLPNENCQITASGNYVIEVFKDNEQDSPVLTACFSVVEPNINILPEATARTNISYQQTYQQVNIDIDYSQFDINDPYNEILVVVEQNRRQDNRVILTTPDYTGRNTMRFINNNQLIFEAGNEYRVFDISSEKVLSERVESIDYFKPYFHATLYPDELRSEHQYQYLEDVNGRYKINVQFSDQSQTDGDYYFTHFSLPIEQPFANQDVYLMGELTGNRIGADARMTYNPATRCYEKTLLLKQGGYNYLYLVAERNKLTGTLQPIEGNFWQTQNEYAIYVYHRPFGAKYEKLIGFSTVTTNSKTY